MRWQLQDAKQRFSELVRTAQADGPQVVTRHGRDVAVLMDIDDYRRVTVPAPDFKDFLLSGPDLSELAIERSSEPARRVDLG
jgi:prevent-host-death family protein